MSLTTHWQNYVLSVVVFVALFIFIYAIQKLRKLKNNQPDNNQLGVLNLITFLLFFVFVYFLFLTFTHNLGPIYFLFTLSALVTAILVWVAIHAHYETAVNLTKSQALEHFHSTHDDLTSLPNLAYFNEQLEKTFNVTRREDDEFALLIIGLNRFKIINETLGYFVGDAILAEIAQRIRSALRKTDLIARLGGDEFAVLINPVLAQGHIHTISKNIAESVQEPLAVEGNPADVGVAIGVSIYPKHAKNSVEMIEKARNAMMVAEKHGLAVVVYDENSADSHIQDIQIIGMLQRAIQNEQLLVLYQQQVRLSDEKIISVEALIRWQHPNYGLLDPGRFIPYAEKAGLIYEINLWLLKEVIEQATEWHEKDIHLPIAFNITANGILNKDFQIELNTNLKLHSWLAEKLKIELTETSRIEHIEEIYEAMLNYKKRGLSFSLDDYGTKHASLEYLKRLPFDELKIDQSFMANAASDEDSQAIIQHAREIAQQLKLTTTAEGVENEEVLKIAKEIGINNGQGYQFNSALNAQEIEKIISNNS